MGSGAERADSSSAAPASQPGFPASAPGLKRVNSLPGRLPSHPAPHTEVKPERKPITRARPDTHPPQDFARPPVHTKFWGIPLRMMKGKAELERLEEESIMQGAIKKESALMNKFDDTGYTVDYQADPEYMDVIRAYHPKFDTYSEPYKSNEAFKILMKNPRYRAGMAQCRNEVSRIPNGPTSTRKMEPEEQKFLTRAFRRIQEDIREKPFHIHGESGVLGNWDAEITWFDHNPANNIAYPFHYDDKCR
jgi:hypothetical protein